MTVQALLSSERGFTLVEILFATVIMTVGLLALLHSVNVAMEHNLRNHIRDEATLVAEEKLTEMKYKTVSLLTNGTTTETVPSKIRGFTKNYTVEKKIDDSGSGLKSIQVTVKWNYKGTDYTHSVMSLKGQ